MPDSKILLAGVKVRARRWFKTRTTLTDGQGNYNISSFKNKVNYSIKWERNDYDIRDGLFFQAYFSGPKKRGNWDVDLVSGKALRHATIHRAAHRYFYQNIGGLRSAHWRPPNGQYDKLKLAYFDYSGGGANWGGTWLVFPTITIHGKYDNGQHRETDILYSLTTHEIGHSTQFHALGGLIQFAQVSKILRESWPEAIAWHITTIEYVDRGVANYNVPGTPFIGNDHKQTLWNIAIDPDYTPIFIDLVDNFDLTGEPNDQITGYTMQTLEQIIVPHAYGLTSFRDRLKSNKPTGVTNQQIDDYFAYYFNNL